MTGKRSDHDNDGPENEATKEVGRAQSSSPSPEEGRRLVVAFLGIKDATARDAIISLVEKISQTYAERD